MVQSFREYLLHNTGEHEFRFFARTHFRNLFEYAQHKEKRRFPVGIDKDDIEFLQQFEAGGAVKDIYAKAIKQRYEMLFKALENRQNYLNALGYDQLVAAIAKAIRTQNRADWNALVTFDGPLRMTQKQVADLQRVYQPSETQDLSDEQIHQNAEELAFRHARRAKDLEHIADDSQFAEFSFPAVDVELDTGKQTGARHTTEQFTIRAKPMINRLYHKLEQDVGATHIPGSGLTGAGKYGFGLHDPVRSFDPKFAHMTQGMKFPTEAQISERVRDFLNHQAHRTFGKIPDDENIVWKKVQGEDRETINFHKQKLVKDFYDQLFGRFQHYKQISRSQRSNEAKEFMKKYKNPSALLKEATRLANEKLKEDVQKGLVYGPPIPGVNPQGFKPQYTVGIKQQKVEQLIYQALSIKNDDQREEAWNKLLMTGQGGTLPQAVAFSKKKLKELMAKYKGLSVATMSDEVAKRTAKRIADEHFDQPVPGKEKPRKELDKGTVVHPPLYLPHEEVETTDENGEKTKKLVPFMLPFKFYRVLGKNPKKDYVREPILVNGEPVYDKKGRQKMRYKLDDNLRPIPAHPDNQRHGWHKMFVHDGETNPYGKDIQRDGAIDFNHNTKGLLGLSEGSPAWKRAFAQAFGRQDKVTVTRYRGKWNEKPAAPNDKTAFYKDFWQGVKNCIESESCGGRKSDYEIKRMRENYRELYHLVYLTAMQGINNDEFKTPKGRISWAQRTTSEYGQKNWGRGGRRLRLLDDRNKMKWSPDLSQHVGKGERKLDIKGLALPYRIDSMRKYLSKLALMKSQAEIIDAQTKQMEQMPEPENDERSLLASFQSLKNKRENFDDEAVEFLATLDALVNNKSEEEAIADAEAQIGSWMEEGFLNASIIKKIEESPLFHEALQKVRQAGYKPATRTVADQEDDDLNDELIYARNVFIDDLEKEKAKFGSDLSLLRLQNNPELRNNYIAELPSLSPYVRGLLKPQVISNYQWLGLEENKQQLQKLLNMTQNLINRYFADPSSAQTAKELAGLKPSDITGTRSAESEPPVSRIPVLRQAQKLGATPKPAGSYLRYIHIKTPQARYHLSHDPEFLEDASEEQLRRLHSFWQTGQFQEPDKQSAMTSIEGELKKRGLNV